MLRFVAISRGQMKAAQACMKAKIASADTPNLEVAATGYLDVTSTQFNFTYNFMTKSFTPYVSGGFGWNWIDSNIPSGYNYGGCWWDPWYGYICGGYQSTYGTTAFTYGLGAGVRLEPKDNMFIRLGLNDNWQDLGTNRFNQSAQNSMINCGSPVLNGNPGAGNDCFTYRPAYSLGTDGGGLWHSQRFIAANAALSKEVTLKEGTRLQLRLDFQNPFKWFNWGGPNTNLNIQSIPNSKTFGSNTGASNCDTDSGSTCSTASFGVTRPPP